jgi:signal transduction histidine kinase
MYLTGGLMLTLRNSGFFEFNFWTTHFVEIGAASETTIIALALGARYRKYKEDKEAAQQLALKLQRETTEMLEIKVKERTEQLSRANEELSATLDTNRLQTEVIEKKNAELDDFFYRVSHDLRGPISSLLAMSFLAKKEVTDTKALEYINRQKDQADRLNGIINALISLTKLSHGGFKAEPINFTRMIEECIHSFAGHANYSKITFRKNIQSDLEFESGWVFINAILQNLIENGIKYCGKKDPYVQIDIKKELDIIIIEVSDNGQGIPDDLQFKIFDMFFRASQSAGGSGLGLYILKRSVDRLKGKVEIESKVGLGSTFKVKLPMILK